MTLREYACGDDKYFVSDSGLVAVYNIAGTIGIFESSNNLFIKNFDFVPARESVVADFDKDSLKLLLGFGSGLARYYDIEKKILITKLNFSMKNENSRVWYVGICRDNWVVLAIGDNLLYVVDPYLVKKTLWKLNWDFPIKHVAMTRNSVLFADSQNNVFDWVFGSRKLRRLHMANNPIAALTSNFEDYVLVAEERWATILHTRSKELVVQVYFPLDEVVESADFLANPTIHFVSGLSTMYDLFSGQELASWRRDSKILIAAVAAQKK